MKNIKTRKFSSLNVAHSRPIVFRRAGICDGAGLLWDFTPNPKWVRMGGELKCSCVYACPQFQATPVDKWGVHRIPRDAQCPYITGPCRGAHWFVRGTSAKNPGHYVEYTDSKAVPVAPWNVMAAYVKQDNWIRRVKKELKQYAL
ncbi:hypothetical protein HDR63_02665 [bacterium]|nr:hypothetical protein [bacterium]